MGGERQLTVGDTDAGVVHAFVFLGFLSKKGFCVTYALLHPRLGGCERRWVVSR